MNFENKKATRQSYGEALAELGRENKDVVVLDADLAGATKTNIFSSLPGPPIPIPKFKPHFMCTFRVENAPIRLIDSIPNEKDKIIVVQGKQRIKFLEFTDKGEVDQKRGKMLRNEITALTALNNNIIVGLSNGDIETINIASLQKMQVYQLHNYENNYHSLNLPTFNG